MVHEKKTNKYWLIIAILCGFTASFSIPFNSTGAFMTPVIAELGFQRGDFSLHATLTLFFQRLRLYSCRS